MPTPTLTYYSWWINPLFAFRDGMIDSGDPGGGIVTDNHGAYAILLTGKDDVTSSSPEQFIYRARDKDRGRYRLTAATRDCRQPVRVLRSHTLQSFWSPRAGVRYDGLYRVIAWSMSLDPRTKQTTFDITFQRLASELPMETVLLRPWMDEVEDYREYKRLRTEARSAQGRLASRKLKDMPRFTFTVDGSSDVEEWNPVEDDAVVKLPRPKDSLFVADLPFADVRDIIKLIQGTDALSITTDDDAATPECNNVDDTDGLDCDPKEALDLAASCTYTLDPYRVIDSLHDEQDWWRILPTVACQIHHAVDDKSIHRR